MAKRQPKTKSPAETAQTAARAQNARRHEKRRRRRMALFALALSVFCLAVLTVLSFTVFFKIRDVAVEGDDLPCAPEEIAAASGIRPDDNLLGVDIERAEAQILAQFAWIDAVTVLRRMPDTVAIKVTRGSIAYTLHGGAGQVVNLSSGGRVLSTSPEEATGVPVIGIAVPEDVAVGMFLDEANLPALAVARQIAEAMQGAGLSAIDEINLSDPFALTARYGGRVTLLFGSQSELDYKLRFAVRVLRDEVTESERGTIDASQSGKVHFLPERGDASSQAASSGAESATDAAL